MQLASFEISGLFGDLQHKIKFPIPKEKDTGPSLVILHGRNGVGKTTILRMLDGLLRLDFNEFRRIPFIECSLQFDSDEILRVRALRGKVLSGIEVTLGGKTVVLHPDRPGSISDVEKPKVEEFRALFFKKTETLIFEFIDTERLYRLQQPNEEVEVVEDMTGISRVVRRHIAGTVARPNPKARSREVGVSIASRVKRFIQQAQVNYRTFFSTTEPDLFPRIIERLTSKEQSVPQIEDLRGRVQRIHSEDAENIRFGLEPDKWDYEQMMTQLEALSHRRGTGRKHALTVLGSYVELLESRAAERKLVADRLMTFERLMKDFLGDKSVVIHPRIGIEIRRDNDQTLQENQLSTGEFHLLYLMVTALVTRRTGTVIAIDEPEMSMHLAWQRKLIPALLQCASRANPLFLFATHSPDVAASYPDAMVELS